MSWPLSIIAHLDRATSFIFFYTYGSGPEQAWDKVFALVLWFFYSELFNLLGSRRSKEVTVEFEIKCLPPE